MPSIDVAAILKPQRPNGKPASFAPGSYASSGSSYEENITKERDSEMDGASSVRMTFECPDLSFANSEPYQLWKPETIVFMTFERRAA